MLKRFYLKAEFGLDNLICAIFEVKNGANGAPPAPSTCISGNIRTYIRSVRIYICCPWASRSCPPEFFLSLLPSLSASGYPPLSLSQAPFSPLEGILHFSLREVFLSPTPTFCLRSFVSLPSLLVRVVPLSGNLSSLCLKASWQGHGVRNPYVVQ